jgi:hypothetical protein
MLGLPLRAQCYTAPTPRTALHSPLPSVTLSILVPFNYKLKTPEYYRYLHGEFLRTRTLAAVIQFKMHAFFF